MSQCFQCEHNRWQYEFSTSTADFNLAQQTCANKGGALARYLDEDAYLEIRKCCQNGLHYWIGLFKNFKCSSNPLGPYTWDGNTACTSGSPLNIIPLQDAAPSSQAVTILLDSDKLVQPPFATERVDFDKQHYICQYALTTSTTNVSTLNTPTSRALTSVGTTIPQSTAATIVRTVFSTWPTTTGNQNPYQNISYAALIGIIIGTVLICLLAGTLALYCCCKKRNSMSDNKEISENHAALKSIKSSDQEKLGPNAQNDYCK